MNLPCYFILVPKYGLIIRNNRYWVLKASQLSDPIWRLLFQSFIFFWSSLLMFLGGWQCGDWYEREQLDETALLQENEQPQLFEVQFIP